MAKLRVLFWDIETAPLLAHVWHPFGDYVGQDQLIGDSFMLTWAAKWEDGKKIMSDRLDHREVLEQDDSRIVESLAKVIRQADVIVAHNGDKFDIPVLNKRLMMNELEPLAPVTVIDTYKLAKQNFRMEMNKLDFLAERLGVGRKIETKFTLWREAYQGSEDALRKMERYNKHDVLLLQGVFDKMRPYVKRLARMYEAETEWDFICTNCGATEIESFQKRGRHRTQASTFQTYQCKTCGRYYRDRIGIRRHKSRLYPL